MEITGTVLSAKTKEPLGEAKITLSVGTTEMASLYSDGKGYFAHEEATDYIGETLTCAAEKEGFKTKTLTHTIEEQIIPLEIAMEEDAPESISKPDNRPSILPKILIGAGIGVVVLALVLVGVFVILKFFGNGNGKKVEIISFKAAPSSINKGEQSILTWETKNAAEVIIEPLGRRFESSGENKVSPHKTTTYTLMARNEEGKEVREVTVNVKVKVLPHVVPEALRPVRPEVLREFPSVALLPDLYISEFSLSPSTPTQGKPVKVRIGVYNRGTARAGGFTVEWWAGENFPKPAKVWQVTGSAARGGKILTYTYDGYPSWYGKLTTKAVADSKGKVEEQNEHNNVKKMEIQVRKK